MLAYKLKEDYTHSHTKFYTPDGYFGKGRLVVLHNNGYILLATPTKPTHHIGKWMFEQMGLELFEEVNLLEEYWVHPHLYKPIQLLVRQQLETA